MSDSAIQFQNVWKKFRRGERYDSLRDLIPALTTQLFSSRKAAVGLEKKEFWALRDVSFELKRGDAIGIIGPNGSGKSTILKLLSNVLRADRGSISVRGRAGALIELGAGFHPDLTGRENIYLNGTILGMKRSDIERKFDSIVEFAELEHALDTPVKRYSSGMYARLGFSVAVHVEPEVLIVDEVLSVGDYHFQEKCYSKMKEFTRNGTTLVFVSHNLAAVSTLCSSALLLKYGEPIYYGDVGTAISKYYSFYEGERASEDIEVLEAVLVNTNGNETDIFSPGETATFVVKFRALRGIANAHACMYVVSKDGQQLFDTATSRYTDQRVTLNPGQEATVTFQLDLNLQSDVFQIGFALNSEFDEYFLYQNMGLKRVVMRGDRKSNGFVFFNPKAELTLDPKNENSEPLELVEPSEGLHLV